MANSTEIISRFSHYPDADAAVTKLTSAGYSLRNLGIVGDANRTALRGAGVSRAGDRVRHWTMRAAIAGAGLALVAGAVLGAHAIAGGVFVVGYLAAIGIYVAEGGLMAGAIGMAAAAAVNATGRKTATASSALVSSAGNFMLVVRGTREENDLARSLVAVGGQ